MMSLSPALPVFLSFRLPLPSLCSFFNPLPAVRRVDYKKKKNSFKNGTFSILVVSTTTMTLQRSQLTFPPCIPLSLSWRKEFLTFWYRCFCCHGPWKWGCAPCPTHLFYPPNETSDNQVSLPVMGISWYWGFTSTLFLPFLWLLFFVSFFSHCNKLSLLCEFITLFFPAER